jgi:Zn-dependent protease
MDLDPGLIREALLNVIIVMACLAVHEWGHAVTADRLGDPTPRMEGRVTLNPFAHIDLIGTLLIPLLGALGFFGSFSMIGWAKPVMTNPSNFKNRNRDQAWVTIAGPGMNLVLALAATVGLAIAYRVMPTWTPLFEKILAINVGLMVFNLLPIPPLDGSKFLMYWFGMSEETYARFAQFGGIILLVLINIPAFRYFLGKVMQAAMIPFATILNVLI